jgi:tRNA pseudouridine38-40 synthase
MRTFKLTIAYDGTGLVGWQRQAAGTSVQGLLEDALSDLDGRAVAVAGAGRTDAGVHAIGQVASVALEREIDARTVIGAVNIRLPASVRIVDAVEAAPQFHARFDACSKAYRYRIWNAAVMSPFERAYAWHVPSPALDVRAMAAAARLVAGTHDFAAFQAADGERRRSERTVLDSRVGGEGALITYDISGDGFLRHMVRCIVGTLLEVGRGRRGAEWVSEVVQSRHRAAAGPTAPPEGLFLVSVSY